jgi:hypothetical protein
LPGVYFVSGTVKMAGPIRFSRNMTVVRQGDRLVIVNSVRLDDAGLAALDKLGKVTDVVRLAANHGMDDPFYADRYGAKVWAVRGQRYVPGFKLDKPDIYFEPHNEMDETTELPIAGAKLYVIHATPNEGLLVYGDTIISGDCLQHWAKPDEYFSFLGGVMMRMMGFIKPHNIGPGWFKQCKPPKPEMRAILDLSFANVLPVHGAPVIGDAPGLYRAAIERVTAG